ncbi:hypothetical protein JCM10207_008863 [Rhodosporidiobolus poonsookiae]
MSTSSSPSTVSGPSFDPSPSSSLSKFNSTRTRAGDEGPPSNHKQDDDSLRPAPFDSLPLEIVDLILVFSLPNEPDERLEYKKRLSTVSKDFRAWAMPRMFPSSWTLGKDVDAVKRVQGWRERPALAARVKTLNLSNLDEDRRQSPIPIVEEVVQALTAVERISAVDWDALNLRVFFSCQRLTALHLRVKQLNWLCSGSLPSLRTLTLVSNMTDWSSVDEVGIAHLFQPTTLPSLRELFLFLFNNRIGGREASSWQYRKMYHKDLEACSRLSDLVLRILPQLVVFEHNLLSPVLVGPFPPSPPILHTFFLGSEVYHHPIRLFNGRPSEEPSYPLDDRAKLDYLVRHFPSLTVRHLRIQLSFVTGRKPWLVLAAEIDALLAHPIFADLETLILPRDPLRDAEDWLKPRLDERRIRLEFEEMVNDDYWMEPSSVWRRICADGEEKKKGGEA